MKGRVGIFLAGVAAGFLLDPLSSKERRAKVAARLEPLRQRVMGAKDQAAASDTVQDASDTAQSAADSMQASVASTFARVAGQVQGRINDAAGKIGLRRSQSDDAQAPAPSTNGVSSPEGGSTQDVAAEQRAEVSPRNIVDPIPEGTTNDPTLVARVESELFRDHSIPKGEVIFDAVNGVVTLRGTVDAKTADKVLERTRAVDGVTKVVDMLHRN
jgi:osmotically-inducible protein OsmY